MPAQREAEVLGAPTHAQLFAPLPPACLPTRLRLNLLYTAPFRDLTIPAVANGKKDKIPVALPVTITLLQLPPATPVPRVQIQQLIDPPR